MSQKTSQSQTGTEQHSAIDSIAQSLIEGMPEPQEHAIQQHNQQIMETAQKQNVTDKSGAKFDGNLHSVDDTGNPIFTAGGMFAKKRGRKTGGASSLGTSAKPAQSQTNPVEQVKINKQLAAGSMMANALITMGIVLGGEEWQPIKNEQHGIDEQQMLTQSFADYLEARGMEDIGPNTALVIAVLGYALPRFTMPKTQSRTASLFTKAKIWWANRKLKKHNLQAVEKEEK